MANKARGEIVAEIGGQSYKLTLCLGALAELEAAFNVDSFEQALDFTKASATRMRLMLFAVLRGNGHETTEQLSEAVNALTLPAFMAIITDLMNASGLTADDKPAPEGDRPLAARKGGRSG